ncbi:MAG: Rab family GTPase [Candidatus Asgardarchaeia archaeon]
MSEKPYIFKVVMAGDGAVGKTSLVRQYVTHTFQKDYLTTLGVQVSTKELRYPNLAVIKLVIWDVAGQQLFSTVRPMYYKEATVAIVVYDITSKETFEHVPRWVDEARQNEPRISIIIAGNKKDLEYARQVPTEDGEKLAKEVSAEGFVETSARTGEGVNKLFEMAVTACLKKKMEELKKMAGGT